MNTLFSFRILVLAFSLFSLPFALGAQCVHPDYGGLEMFYLATNGDSWDDNTGWLTDCEPCSWKGIECDANERVVTILLRDNGLTGTLPADFGDLTELNHLAIPRNEVGGTLPAALFTLAKLRDLNLSRNKFAGELSADITLLTNIEYLRMGRNQFTGAIPVNLPDCTRLKHIELEENGFTDRIPEGLGDLIDLKVISLFNNDLEGCFPADITGDLCGRIRGSFSGNTKLSWEGDYSQLCLGSITEGDQTGAPCDDGNPDTGTDLITEDCLCGGTIGSDGLVAEGPEVGGFSETEEPQVGRFVRVGSAPGVVPDVSPAVSRLTAFPNPLVGGALNVRIPETMAGAEVRLLSLNGREIVRTGNVSSGFSLTVPVLEAGVYLLEAVSGTERSVTRIIVQ